MDQQDLVYKGLHNIFYDERPFISSVIFDLRWGNNLVIRSKGIYTHPITGDPDQIEKWNLIKYPYTRILETTYVKNPKTKDIVIVHVGEV